MAAAWEQLLRKWQDAGLIDAEAAARIREFEGRETGLRWPAIAAIAFGGIMLAAGVLLFVSAHWDEIAPSTRFATVVLMVAVFHAGGAYAASRMDALATALHGIGTAALGAGIYLSGQIFNMSAHWPAAILMWAVGALIGWLLRRDWLQMAFLAILAPSWIAAEWMDAHPSPDQAVFRVLAQGILLLAITYFTAPKFKALLWIGGIALLPWALALALSKEIGGSKGGGEEVLASAVALLLPVALAVLLRGEKAWMNGIAALWVMLLNFISKFGATPWLYLWCGLGAAGMVGWGLAERRGERINIGMAGFAITVFIFYFSSVMDKLGAVGKPDWIGSAVSGRRLGARKITAAFGGAHEGAGMTALAKGLILCGIQTAMVLSIGGKMLLDRTTLPRIWVRTLPYDPNAPIRGRYVSLTINAEARGFPTSGVYEQVRYTVEDGKLVARAASKDGTGAVVSNLTPVRIAYFIPEHVPDPSRRPPDEELWAEVTVPRLGPPRPIQLGVKKNGVITPLGLN